MRFKTLLAVGVALAWMLLAQPALGATVSFSIDGELVYEAALGELNDVQIVEEPRRVYLITDLNAAVTSQTTRCTAISPNAVRCVFDVAEFDPGLAVRTGDGADTAVVDNRYGTGSTVDGGAGADSLFVTRESVVFGGPGEDRLLGGTGPQFLRGGSGADSLDGGVGDDVLRGGAGADVMAGGPGTDEVDYGARTTPTWISLDDRPNDGAAGESDWVRADVENATGGSMGPTTFIGNANPNFFIGGDRRDVVRAGGGDDVVFAWGGSDLLAGGPGDDSLEGLDGRDRIAGGPGNDVLRGGHYGGDLIRGGRGNDFLGGDEGADDLRGGRGRDRLSGGPQDDVLRGGPGRDHLRGDSGADVLYTRDRNREIVRGGLGHDRAHVDPIDALWSIEALF